MIARLASACGAHPVRVIALWAVAVVAACAAVALLLGEALTSNIETTRQTGCKQGDALLARAVHGVSSTARLITGAALIIVAVFAGFARGDLIMFQQMGFGVAAALLIDATIVRAVLVPAGLKLLGKCNWYLPSWLSWLPDAHPT